MTTGEKIRRIRTFRKMTQKELADRVGLTANGANRIAQYEMGYRVPKKALLEKMAEAMDVCPLALLEPNTGNLGGIMEALLWIDEEMPGIFQFTKVAFDDPGIVFDEDAYVEPYEATLHGNTIIPNSVFPPTVLWTENGLLDQFFNEWGKIKRACFLGEITKDQYFEWKLQWPRTPSLAGRLTGLY